MKYRRFSEAEIGGVWGWTTERRLAFVFDNYEEAETHAKALTDAPGRHPQAITVGSEDAGREFRERVERRANDAHAALLASINPAASPDPKPAPAQKPKHKFLSRRPSKFARTRRDAQVVPKSRRISPEQYHAMLEREKLD